jgi:hypothetical protein
MRKLILVLIAGVFFTASVSAQSALYVGTSPDITKIVSSSSGTITLPAGGGTLLTTGSSSSITSLGTIGSGTWQGSIIAPGFGGTGISTASTPTGSILYTSSAGTWATLPPGTSTYVLTSNGTTSAPSWQAVSGGGGGSTVNVRHTPLTSITISTTDNLVVYDGSSNTVSWTFPSANTCGMGYTIHLVDLSTDPGAWTISFSASGTDKISDLVNGGYTASTSENALYDCYVSSTWISDGAGKWIFTQ